MNPVELLAANFVLQPSLVSAALTPNAVFPKQEGEHRELHPRCLW